VRIVQVQQHPSTLAFELIAGVPDVVGDPYPHYRSLREQAPVHRMEVPGLGVLWVLTRYDDCKAVLASHDFGKGSRDTPSRMGYEDAAIEELVANFESRAAPMLMLDPPDHTRIRGLVSRAFTPRRIEALRARIRELVDGVLEEVGPGEVDLLDVLGFPLPVAVIGELVGVPSEDQPRFRSLVRVAASALELFADLDVLRAADAALAEMTAYFEELVEERRLDPQDDLLSALIAVEDDGDTLRRDELIANLILLFAAGFETTTNLIGNGVVALGTHPEQLARIRNDRSLVPGAVEEILRFDSPVQLDGRQALAGATLPDGTAVPEGEMVMTFLGAANRDPARFVDPEQFDVGRADNAPLSFAWGIHHCLGAGLARVEGQCVLDGLLDRYSGLELLDDPPRWRRGLALRGLDSLRVSLMA
jgi:cytochrome P450